MQPQLISEEKVINKIEVGMADFIFTNKRLIVQDRSSGNSSYVGLSSISRASTTNQTVTDSASEKIKPYTVLISLVLVVMLGFYSATQSGDFFSNFVAAFIIFIFPIAIAALILAFVISLITKKTHNVVLFQIFMKDGTLFINDYFQPFAHDALKEIEAIIIKHTIS